MAAAPPEKTAGKAPEKPKGAPRRGKEQIVYIKLDDLHAFKNHPFEVRDDEEMRAMVSRGSGLGRAPTSRLCATCGHRGIACHLAALYYISSRYVKYIYSDKYKRVFCLQSTICMI